MDGNIILIVIVRTIWIEVQLIPQLEVSYLCHLQVNLLLDQNPLVDIKMRYVVDQWEKEGVFVTHQHHGILFIACPAFFQEVLQEILVDVGVSRDGLHPASEICAICGFVGQAFQEGGCEASLLRSEEGCGAEFGAHDECWLRSHEELTNHCQVIILVSQPVGQDGHRIDPIQKSSTELLISKRLSHQCQFIVHDRHLLEISLFSFVEPRSLDICPKQREVPTVLQLICFLSDKVDSIASSIEHDQGLGRVISEDDQAMR